MNHKNIPLMNVSFKYCDRYAFQREIIKIRTQCCVYLIRSNNFRVNIVHLKVPYHIFIIEYILAQKIMFR
jgi:hypothetical protein